MRYIKTFKLFENKGHYNFLEEFCKKVTDSEPSSTVDYNSDTPCVILDVSFKEKSFWKSISKKVSSREAIYWIRDNIDDMMFGETEKELESSIEQLDFYDVDLKNYDKRLVDYINFAARYGMAIDRWLFIETSNEMIVRFRTDKELSHKYRGNIANRKFSA